MMQNPMASVPDYVDIVDKLNEDEWNELWDDDDDPDFYDVKETCDG